MNILISGMTCSGKSTLATKLAQEYNGTHFEEDWYFKDKADIPLSKKGYLMDSPNAFYLDEFKKDVNNLLVNNKVFAPRYDIKINKRIAKDIEVTKSNINVFEGLHTIDTLNDLPNSLKVFIDTPESVCLERRIKRDKEYGINEDVIERYFKEVILEMYRMYIIKQKEMADIVVDGRNDNLCQLKRLLRY